MFKDENILIFDYPFDYQRLNEEFQKFQDQMVSYEDHRGVMDNWRIIRHITFEYADQLNQLFGINARPRFYTLAANTVLGEHRDAGTQCSINILLDPTELAAPVSFGERQYVYRQCLLNTQNLHSVTNGPHDRRLFKLSVFDQTYEEVCEKVLRVLG